MTPAFDEPTAARILGLARAPRGSRSRALAAFAVILALAAHAAPGGGFPASARSAAMASAGASPQARESAHMKRLMAIGAAAAVSAGASAQDAVQWRVELGGNGHWYRRVDIALSWQAAKLEAEALGGHLATVTSSTEWLFLKAALPVAECWSGASQYASNPDYSEPAGGWAWVTGEPFVLEGYMSVDDCPAGPPSGCSCGSGAQDALHFTSCCANVLDDIQDGSLGDCNYYPGDEPNGFIIEYDADCNNDGIVDYGQIRGGELTDANANNIPDCCEAATDCPNSLAPVEWRVADGGNGHWYGLRVDPLASLDDFDSGCERIGGHLVSLGSAREHQFVVDLMIAQDWLARIGWPAIGLRRTSSASPWRWSTGEPVEYVAWAPGEPSDAGLFAQLWGTGAGPNLTWSSNGNPFVSTGVIEFSADCNADGLVDYGQIRSGELSDANANNIPDCCENGTPCGCAGDTNLDGTIDGIDLATVLTRWAQSAAKFPNADCNRDGVIDGSDLAIVLGSWGACP
jgi:hypothetical protein